MDNTITKDRVIDKTRAKTKYKATDNSITNSKTKNNNIDNIYARVK